MCASVQAHKPTPASCCPSTAASRRLGARRWCRRGCAPTPMHGWAPRRALCGGCAGAVPQACLSAVPDCIPGPVGSIEGLWASGHHTRTTFILIEGCPNRHRSQPRGSGAWVSGGEAGSSRPARWRHRCVWARPLWLLVPARTPRMGPAPCWGAGGGGPGHPSCAGWGVHTAILGSVGAAKAARPRLRTLTRPRPQLGTNSAAPRSKYLGHGAHGTTAAEPGRQSPSPAHAGRRRAGQQLGEVRGAQLQPAAAAHGLQDGPLCSWGAQGGGGGAGGAGGRGPPSARAWGRRGGSGPWPSLSPGQRGP